MLKVTLKNLIAHKRRLAGTFVAVVLGVAFLAGNLVLADTISSTFNDLFANVYRGTDVVVRSASKIENDFGNDQRGRIDADLLSTVEHVDGVRAAEPQITGYGQIVGKDGKALGNPGMGAPTFAGNWSTVPELQSFHIVDGKPPSTNDEVVIDRKSSKDGNLRVGDHTTVLTASGPVPFTVSGIAKFGSADSPGGASFALMTLDAAQQYLSKPGQVDSIATVAQRGVSQHELAQRVQRALPNGVEAVTGAQVTKEQQDSIQKGLSRFFDFLLRPFAIIAILVSIFVIYNTFSIIVAQRTREMALLRALGASRRQVLASVVGEAFLVGVVASVVGLFAGLGIAAGLKGVLAAFGFDVPVGGLTLKSSTVQWAFVVGIGVSVLTSIIPGAKASRVPPLAAMRDVAVERTSVSRVRVGIGSAAGVLGLVLVIAGVVNRTTDALPGVGLGALLLIVALVVIGPAIAAPIGRALGAPIARLRGMPGQLARDNATRNPRRTSGAASALLIGVAVVALFTVIAASIKASVDEQINRSFAGDLVVDSRTFGFGGFNPKLASDIGTLPSVAAASGIRFGNAKVNGTGRQVVVIDPATLAQVFDIGVASGSLASLDGNGVAVSTRYADDHKLKVGDTVPATYPDGTSATLTIGATFQNSDVFGSDFALTSDEWGAHAIENLDSVVIVKTRPGASLAEARQEVEKVAAAYPNAKVQDRDQYKQTVFAQVNQLQGLIYVMLFLAIVIALMGIANTLSLSIYERTRELGLLRAVGETRAQLRTMVRWESVIIAVFGTIGGIALGAVCSWALISTLSDTGFATFRLPVGSLLVVLVLGALAGVLAAIRPARRAARLDVLQAITTE